MWRPRPELSGQAGGPFGSIGNSVWRVPVLPTPSLPQNECLVGAFGLAARFHDRLEVEVVISTEHSDFFTKNMVAIRAENRVALTCRVPAAFCYCDDLGLPGTSS
jgi:HK97 family phage major capsid protein